MTIEELLKELNIPCREGGTHRHVRHGWVGLQCPWCGTSSWHLGIRLSDGFCTCWRCGSHRLGDVVMEITGRGWPDVKKLIQSVESGHLGPQDGPRRDQSAGRITLPSGLMQGLGGPHRRYLAARGFDPNEIASVWGVRGIGLAARMAWRLWIPITVRGSVVSWTTRTIGSAQPRYISASPEQEALSHRDVLYGADLAYHTAVVCEGPIDAWAIGPGGVAVFGLMYSRAQVLEIASYPRRIVCLDATEDGQARAAKLVGDLRGFDGETFNLCLETGKDPAEADAEEINQLRNDFLCEGRKT